MELALTLSIIALCGYYLYFIGEEGDGGSERENGLIMIRESMFSTSSVSIAGCPLEMQILSPSPDRLLQKLSYGAKQSVL